MPAPRITVRWQSRLDKTITVHGVIGGPVNAARISMPAAAVPAGAVSQPEVTLALNTVGEFTHTFTSLPYGEYDSAVITASNADGTSTAYSWPMRLYAPGTAPVATPRAILPPHVVPSFTTPSVAMGAEVTSITVESTSTSNQADAPFTFGQPFKAGALAPSDFLVGKVAGEADIPLQFNVKATHPNGSVRHAIISGKLPALAAGATKTISIVRAASGASTTPAAASAVMADGLTAEVNLVIAGVSYFASASPSIDTIAPKSAWIGGAIATEYITTVPLKDAGGVEHPLLSVQFAVRRYAGTNKAKIDVIVENTRAYTATSDVTYKGSVVIGGVQALVIAKNGGADVIHYPCARWKRTLWWNNANPVHVKHNVKYLCDSLQIPNYDQRITIKEETLASYVTELATPAKFDFFTYGKFPKAWGGPGGRQDLGLAPGWYAAYILSQDKRAKDLMLALGECAGTWRAHRRDDVEGSPFKGYPIDVNTYPKCTTGNLGDSKNTASGQYEKFPATTSVATDAPDRSHQPAMSYIPYLVTGDWFYLEELHFWGSWNAHTLTPGNTTYRQAEKGIVVIDQVRGQAWSLRTLAECAAITPDNHPLKASWLFYLQNNLSYLNAMYTDNPAANPLGVITDRNDGEVIYSWTEDKVVVGGTTTSAGVTHPNTGIGLFQDDFFTQSIGHAAELGFSDALRMLKWKAKFPVGRMISPGACWTHAAYPQSFAIKATATSPYFTTIAEGQRTSLTPAINALPCNSQARVDQINVEIARPHPDYVINQMTGYAHTESYSANMQPALAMAVDAAPAEYPDSDLAWDLFDSRAKQPAYNTSPQFAIVPRGVTLSVPEEPLPDEPPPPPPPPDEPDLPDPTPTPPGDPIMAIADRIKDTTVTTGVGAFVLDGAPPINFRPFLTAPITVGSIVPYACNHMTLNEWEHGFGTLTGALQLERTTVTDSSNGGAKVNFSAGQKEVFVDLTTAFMSTFASANSTVVTALDSMAVTGVHIDVGGVPKLISVSEFLTSLGVTVSQLTKRLPEGPDLIPFVHAGEDHHATVAELASVVGALIGANAPVTDGAAPQLSNPMASATSATAATASITTNEGNGTLYCLVSVGSTATAAAVKDGASQAITATGNKSFNITGLTASTTYYAHFLHRDAAGNESTVWTSASFATQAAGAPTPTVTGVVVSPATANVNGGATQQFTAVVNGANSPSQAVTWTASIGTISTSGLYTAPAATASAQTVTITAKAVQDGTTTGTATVTVPASTLVDYTVSGYSGNAIKATMDGSDANKSNSTAYPSIRGFAYAKYASSQYWNITPPSGGTAPASAHSGWSNSPTVPPEKITSSGNQSGDTSINGATPMSKPGAWANTGNYLWVPIGSGTTYWYYWILPEGGVPKVANPKDANGNPIPLTVTGA